MVYRRCLRLLGNESRAEEAMQDVFVKAWQAEATLLQHPNPGAFLYRVATHQSLNLIRASKRRPETADSEFLSEVADLQSETREPTDRLLATALLENEEVSTRLMVVYHYVDGMTLEELADEFGMSISGIRKRLAKFKTKSQGATDEHTNP